MSLFHLEGHNSLVNPTEELFDTANELFDVSQDEECVESQSEVKSVVVEELIEDKPVDENSEVVPNKNLTDDEIAQLILEEEELLPAGDQGVLG